MKSKPYDKCLSTLSNSLKLEIISELRRRPKTVSEIVSATGEEQSKVSHALQRLRLCGFVSSSNKGRTKVYQLSKGILTKIEGNRNLFDMLEYHYKHVCKGRCQKILKNKQVIKV